MTEAIQVAERRGEQLREQALVAFVAVSDPERAKAFYRDKLNLRMVSEELPFALVFDAHGTMLRVTLVKEVKPAGHTVLGWAVPDAAQTVEALRVAGVAFERVPGLQQDERGIWVAPGGTKVAWFKDPDGNVLSISQHGVAVQDRG